MTEIISIVLEINAHRCYVIIGSRSSSFGKADDSKFEGSQLEYCNKPSVKNSA